MMKDNMKNMRHKKLIPLHNEKLQEKNKELVPYEKLRDHTNSVECAQFLPTDTSKLISGSHDGLIKIWDINKMEVIKNLRPHSEGIWSMKVLKDGKRVVSGSPDFSVSVSDLTSKSAKPIVTKTEHEWKIFSVDVSEDEKLMVTSGSGSEIRFWDFNKM